MSLASFNIKYFTEDMCQGLRLANSALTFPGFVSDVDFAFCSSLVMELLAFLTGPFGIIYFYRGKAGGF